MFLKLLQIASGAIPVVRADTRTLKNCALNILYPNRSWFILRSWVWYSALNTAKGVLLWGYNICMQCGGKHSSTLCAFIYSIYHRLKRCALCISSNTNTFLSPVSISFSFMYHKNCSPYAWKNFILM